MNNDSNKWMLRIDKIIHGPFLLTEIESFILTGKVSEIDEVTKPCDRWFFLRDRVEFLSALEKVKLGKYDRDNSKTENININEVERTQEVTSLADFTKTSPLVEFDSPSEEVKVGSPSITSTPIKKNKKALPLFLTVILASCAALAGYFYLNNPVKVTGLFKKEMKGDFDFNWRAGDHQKALESLIGHEGLKSERELEYASLLMLKQRESKVASKIITKNKNSSNKKWVNLSGLMSFYKNDLNAAEGAFLKAAKNNKTDLEPLINLGHLYRKKNDWGFAKTYFEAAFARKKVGEFDEVGFYLAESWARKVVQSGKMKELPPVITFIKNQLLSKTTFSQNFSILLLWINFYSNSLDSETILKRISFFDPDIFFSRKRSPFTYRPLAKSFDYLCDSLKSTYDDFLNISCSIMEGGPINLNKNVKSSLSSLSTENDFALASFVFNKMGEHKKANEFLVRAFELKTKKGPLKFFEQARFCHINGNFKCAAENWMDSLSFSKESFTAHAGLANAYFETGDYKRAQKFLTRAKDFTVQYVPLNKLELKLLGASAN